MFCRRDPVGIHPLYYVFRPGKFFAFAADIAPLLDLPGIGRRLNRRKAALFLAGPRWEAFDSTLTFFEGVNRLAPGHELIATPHALEIRRYFSWEREPGRSEASLEELSAELRERLRVAVRKQSPHAGLLLSGGLKSAAIAALASEGESERRSPLLCWSFVPVDAPGWSWPDDPRPAIASLAEKVPLTSHPIRWEMSQQISAMDAAAGDQRQPRWFYIREDEIAAFAAAKQAGLSALMTGMGGSWLPLFRPPAGAGWAALRSGDWSALLHKSEVGARRSAREIARIARHDILGPLLPAWLRQHWGGRSLAAGLKFGPAGRRLLLRDSFLVETGLIDWLRERVAHVSRDFRENAYQEMVRGGLQLHLENWDVLGREQGIELRYPFLDTDIIEFCLRLPARYYLRGDPQRVLREAMRGLLPEPIRSRSRRLAAIADWPYRKLQLQALQRSRLAELERHPLLSTLVDLAPIRAALDRFPSEATLRHAVASGGLEAAARLVTPDGVQTTVEYFWSFARFLDRNGFR